MAFITAFTHVLRLKMSPIICFIYAFLEKILVFYDFYHKKMINFADMKN